MGLFSCDHFILQCFPIEYWYQHIGIGIINRAIHIPTLLFRTSDGSSLQCYKWVTYTEWEIIAFPSRSEVFQARRMWCHLRLFYLFCLTFWMHGSHLYFLCFIAFLNAKHNAKEITMAILSVPLTTDTGLWQIKWKKQ